MNTVLERKLALSKAMKMFEKESDLLNIFFVYSECIKELASDRPDDFFKYIDIKNYKISNGEKKEIIGNGVIHVSRYRAPRAIKRKPTDQELLNGSMIRYFIYKRNEPKRVFFEISEEQAKSYKKKTIGINDNLYGLIEFLWKIDGSERDVYENGILIDPGVYETNERIILRMSKKFPILAEMITNYFEYTVYE